MWDIGEGARDSEIEREVREKDGIKGIHTAEAMIKRESETDRRDSGIVKGGFVVRICFQFA